MKVYNAKPKPRALFIGFDEEDLRASGILDLFPTYKIIDEAYELESLRQTEYEVVITFDEHDLTEIDPGLYTVSIGGENLGKQARNQHYAEYSVKYNGSVATEFVVNEYLEELLKRLVEQTLLPIYQNEDSHHTLEARTLQHVGSYGKNFMPSKLWTPLISDADDKVLCGYASRSEDTDIELWYLHSDINLKDLKRWLEVLLERWAIQNPTAFPTINNWKNEQDWQSAEEVSISSKIEQYKLDFAKQAKEFNEKLANLESDMQEASSLAEKELRTLLTSQGDTLKQVVKTTLEDFELEVTDVDQEKEKDASISDKLEDLRAYLNRGDKDQWTCLIEVRGYKKGAKVNDLLRLSRFTKRYMQETGGIAPGAVWYIVNHDIPLKPSIRKTALKESPSEVKEFGKDKGLVIDTVELFKLRRAVEDGITTKAQARQLLTTSVGTFKYRPTTKV